MIVLDASAAAELLGDTQAGKRILARLSSERVLHAPHMFSIWKWRVRFAANRR
jgi:hypothetical protein